MIRSLGVVFLLLVGPACSQETAPRPPAAPPVEVPPPLTEYMGREIAPYMSHEAAPWLVRGSREQEENSARVVEALELKPGQVVCDLGCGNGYYTLRFAPLVGEDGRILAVDIQPEMLALLERRAAEAEVENVRPILGTVIDPKLPKGKVDLVFMVDVYHEFSHPEQMLAAIRESLTTHGRVVLVEFRAEDPKVPIKKRHKMTEAQCVKEMTANGFRLVESFDELPWQHMLFFKRAPDPAPAPEKKEEEGS